MKNYTHLTEENRVQIYSLRKANWSIRKIAKDLEVSPSTISRELKRNQGDRGYRAKQASVKATERKKDARKFTKKTPELIQKINEKLRDDWSPEQISGDLANQGVFISHESIYQHVYADIDRGGDLYKHLRHRHKKRYRKRGKKETRGQIKNKVSIHDRPKIVEEKKRIGDVEIDLVVGKDHKGFIVTVVDRVSKYMLSTYSEFKDAASITNAITSLLQPFKGLIHTITSDNGKEFANHEEIAQTLETKFYFADAYASWQRGLNENTNGLLRQYFPKKSCFAAITQELLQAAQNKLNFRPRKGLNFKTPFEVFSSECSKLGIVC